MKTIKFTNKEREALLHRVTLCDAMHDVFSDTDDLTHLAPMVHDRCYELGKQLDKSREIIVDETSELDREIFVELIEGSTWVAIHDPRNDTNNTPQAYSAAYRTLKQLAEKVALTFGIDVNEIEVPDY